MNKITVELNYKIWNDDLGCRVEVAEDGDGLDLVELRYIEPTSKEVLRFANIDTAMARHVANAMIKVADHIDARVAQERK